MAAEHLSLLPCLCPCLWRDDHTKIFCFRGGTEVTCLCCCMATTVLAGAPCGALYELECLKGERCHLRSLQWFSFFTAMAEHGALKSSRKLS